MSAAPRLRVRNWLALAVALFALNASVTFHNVWPTPWIALRSELSIELGVLLLVLVLYSAVVRPPGRLAFAGVTVLTSVFVIGRYAEVTAPALYGRPVNLYWDAEHLPNVAAMLAEVAPAWLVAVLSVGAAALFAALVGALAWCWVPVAKGLHFPASRRVLGLVATGVVGVYALGHAFEWRVRFRYSLPVAATFSQQAQFFLAARAADRNRNLPTVTLPPADFRRLEGDDVLLVFLESYGAVTYDTPPIARAVSPARDELAHAAAKTGRQIVSAFVSAPTFGGASWLSHASFMSGFEVRDTGDYMLLLTQERATLPKMFKAAGYRATALMPGMKSAWPEGAYYGFDATHGERELNYRGPEFGWWRIPDQFSLASVAALAASTEAQPRFTFLPTINTHIPFLPVPPYQSDWRRLLGSEPFDTDEVNKNLARTPDWQALGGPYAESFVYTFTYLAGYLRERRTVEEFVVLIGDHQPAASVAGLGARWDVPVHVVTRHAGIAAELVAAGFVDGVALVPQQPPIATLPELATLLLRTLHEGSR